MLSATQGTKRPSGFDGSEWLIDMDSNSLGGSGSKKKKRKSRWNTDEEDKTVIPGMPTVIPPSLTKEQEKQYIIHLQIEEISRKLRSGDLGIPANPEDRCELMGDSLHGIKTTSCGVVSKRENFTRVV